MNPVKVPEVDADLVNAIAANLAAVEARIAAACRRAGRNPSTVRLLAVTKGQTAETVRAAYRAGLRCFGENYVQESVAKMDSVRELPDLSWHFIGHLQRNKAALAAGQFALIESIDSIALAERVARIAEERGATQDVLIQVHLGDEPSKAGVELAEAKGLCEWIVARSGLRLLGLMGVAPLVEPDGRAADPRPYFAAARRMFDTLPLEHRQILSLGMSADFEAAIGEGSTEVRIGSLLLGRRAEPPPRAD